MYRLLENSPEIQFFILRGSLYPTFPREKKVANEAIDLPKRLQYRTLPKYLFIPLIILKIWKLLKQEKISEMLLVYPHAPYVLAGFWVAKIKKIPYSIYVHDLWAEGRKISFEAWVARKMEGIIYRTARHLFVLSNALQNFYKEKYGITGIYIPHTIDQRKLIFKEIEWKAPYSITFIGTIHDMNCQLLAELSKAFGSDPDFKVNIFTGTPKHRVKSFGIQGKNVRVDMLAPEKVLEELQNAHVFYIPFEFEHNLPLEMKTLLPTRIFECIAACRPIIIHAPEAYSIGQFVKEHRFAVHQTAQNMDAVRDSLNQIINQPNLREALLGHCRKMIERHDQKRVVASFQQHFK